MVWLSRHKGNQYIFSFIKIFKVVSLTSLKHEATSLHRSTSDFLHCIFIRHLCIAAKVSVIEKAKCLDWLVEIQLIDKAQIWY